MATSLLWAVDYVALDRALQSSKSKAEIQRTLKEFHVASDADSALAIDAGQVVNVPVPDAEVVERVRDRVRLRALASGPVAEAKVDASQLKRTKESPLYTDPGVQSESNWIQKSMSAFQEWVRSLFTQDRPTPRESSSSPSIVPEFLSILMWVFIGAVALGCVFVAAKMVAGRTRRVRKDAGLVNDEEAKLSIDEWLARADALIASGEFREAVRCLYVACLLRLDEARYLEFRRTETNWEHLRRYQGGTMVAGFDLTDPTRRFDRIWYGNQVQGTADADHFKAVYVELMNRLKAVRRVA